MSEPITPKQRLREMAQHLRHALPSDAPMDVGESVQHMIVRLEDLEHRDPLPATVDAVLRSASAMLKTLAELFPQDPLPRKTFT